MFNKVNSLAKSSIWLRFMTVVFVVGLLLVTVSIANAASWSRYVNGTCSGNRPSGWGGLVWSGYSGSTWGSVVDQLDWWNGSGWTTFAWSQMGPAYGANVSIVANADTSYRAGYWSSGSRQAASFSPFNGGWGNPIFWNFTCP